MEVSIFLIWQEVDVPIVGPGPIPETEILMGPDEGLQAWAFNRSEEGEGSWGPTSLALTERFPPHTHTHTEAGPR